MPEVSLEESSSEESALEESSLDDPYEEAPSLPEDISVGVFPEETSEENVSGETESGLPVHALQTAVGAKNAFLYDSSLSVIFAKGDLNGKIYPASITKLYTAYVALQYLDPKDVITAGEELSFVGKGSTIAYITKGHRLTAEMLVQGMMLPSGNDAAYVLAAGAGRVILENEKASAAEAVAAFVSAMNDHAMADGLTGTHFSVPDGYHRDDHYTTMADLWKIAMLVIENESITRYTGMFTARVTYQSGETNNWTNTNRLLDPKSSYYRENVIGLKTGHTSQSGYCLLTAEKRGDKWVLVGVFGCQTADGRFSDTVTLLESLI
jgi:D-alanyl-D-alanine carboxypeptidase (penicillin-binding protein 5/6)